MKEARNVFRAIWDIMKQHQRAMEHPYTFSFVRFFTALKDAIEASKDKYPQNIGKNIWTL